MNITFNYPNDKTKLENRIANIKAFLIQRYIDDLNYDNKTKNTIKESIIKELQKTWRIYEPELESQQKGGNLYEDGCNLY